MKLTGICNIAWLLLVNYCLRLKSSDIPFKIYITIHSKYKIFFDQWNMEQKIEQFSESLMAEFL